MPLFQTGAIEGQNFRKTNKLISLSEKQVVDCSKQNHGCNGGWPYLAFEYVKSAGGIEDELDYPYVARVSFIHAHCGNSPNIG